MGRDIVAPADDAIAVNVRVDPYGVAGAWVLRNAVHSKRYGLRSGNDIHASEYLLNHGRGARISVARILHAYKNRHVEGRLAHIQKLDRSADARFLRRRG